MVTDTDDWINVRDAPERVLRSRATVYRWIKEGRVRTIRPGRGLWVNVPDLLAAESATRADKGRPRGTRHRGA